MFRLEDGHWWFVARRNLLLFALRQWRNTLPEQLHLLDVGCGTGGTLDRLRPFGSVVGLDVEALALSFCRERGHHQLVQASATSLPFADNTFDVVVALDVLEHLPDDRTAAAEIARVLKPGGLLFASVPAYPSLWSRHDVALMHQRRSVPRAFKHLLTEAGLSIERCTHTLASFLPLVFLVRRGQRLLNPNAPPRADVVSTPPVLNTLLRGYLDVEGRLSLRMPSPLGVGLFAIARKK